MKTKTLDTFYGFTLLPLVLGDNNRHCLYIKKHDARTTSEALPKDRTLFVLNLPVDTTDDHLRTVFSEAVIFYHNGHPTSHAGNEEKDDEEEEEEAVSVEPTPTEKNKNRKRKKKHEPEPEKPVLLRTVFPSGSSAHIVFKNSKMLEAALKTSKDCLWPTQAQHTQPLGFERYRLRYALSRPDPAVLQQRVDSFMMKFKANEYEKERLALERMNQMDEDGFVVVSHNKKQKSTDGHISVSTFNGDTFDVSKVKKKELDNFYRFQFREKKHNGKFQSHQSSP
ncbi:ribosomal RNA-processing protein 7-domain-containing protein [Spinellus fusiger]|nr:ribosomal RNA-processing protein 7-domain-containing protein [Spinellus fusiger]